MATVMLAGVSSSMWPGGMKTRGLLLPPAENQVCLEVDTSLVWLRCHLAIKHYGNPRSVSLFLPTPLLSALRRRPCVLEVER